MVSMYKYIRISRSVHIYIIYSCTCTQEYNMQHGQSVRQIFWFMNSCNACESLKRMKAEHELILITDKYGAIA